VSLLRLDIFQHVGQSLIVEGMPELFPGIRLPVITLWFCVDD
jgi:hypothetical protein